MLCWLIKERFPIYIWYSIIFFFFIIIITKMWTWMMSLMSTCVKRSTYLRIKGFRLNAFIFTIEGKNKGNYSSDESLFKVSTTKYKQSSLVLGVTLFFLTLNSFFLLVISPFILQFMFLWEWGYRSLILLIFTLCYTSFSPRFLSLLLSNTRLDSNQTFFVHGEKITWLERLNSKLMTN